MVCGEQMNKAKEQKQTNTPSTEDKATCSSCSVVSVLPNELSVSEEQRLVNSKKRELELLSYSSNLTEKEIKQFVCVRTNTNNKNNVIIME